MNRILYLKIKNDLKNESEEKIKTLVLKLQEKFNIDENSNVLDIEKNINDKKYSDMIKNKVNKKIRELQKNYKENYEAIQKKRAFIMKKCNIA